MKYELVVFGVKDTTETIVEYIQENIRKVDLVITISNEVLQKNQVSGFKGLSGLTQKYEIPVKEVNSYALKDADTIRFFEENEFDIGISMGWQRLIPGMVLDRFKYGVFGFHGNCGYLPFGRGRSPMNWSMIKGDTRFILNMFRYDEKADSPNIFANEMCAITVHDTIRTMQYKNMISSRNMIRKLLMAYEEGNIHIKQESKDFDSWYDKRTAEDGKISFRDRTRDIYNLIRGVTAPFPGAFAFLREQKVTIWDAVPFDEILDFSGYAPGEVIEVFDNNPIVRTVDGSLLIRKYDAENALKKGDILN